MRLAARAAGSARVAAVSSLTVSLPFTVPAGLALETDVASAAWVDERLWLRRPGREGVLVGEIVPEGFDAYVRILHPAWRRVPSGLEPIRWAELAGERGREVHSEVQLRALLGHEFRDGPSWGELPDEGSLPEALRPPLVTALAAFTDAGDRCSFCIWEGYGMWGGSVELSWSEWEPARVVRARERAARRRAEGEREILERIPKVEMMRAGPERVPQRRYLLFRGPIDTVTGLAIEGWSQSPNYWWPGDRAWIVVSEIDAPFTYVGGSTALAQALLAEPGLEVVPSDVRHRFDWLGDRINDRPER
jgi:hypothetical protein